MELCPVIYFKIALKGMKKVIVYKHLFVLVWREKKGGVN